MRLTIPNGDRLDPETRLAFDTLLARINTIFEKEHNGDGTHKVITATSVTATGALAGDSLTLGTPTAGNKGTGTINISADAYKNNSAYTNP